MADVQRLFAEFIEAHLGGRDPEPWEYISRLEGSEREQLEELIDAYYMDAPPRPWDAEAFRGSEAERLVDAIDRSFRGRAGLWPAVLPRLRDRARLKRGELVSKLAEALGVSDREDKVGSYYHEMEQGLLPAEGVADRVLEGLGRLLGTTAEALRRAGRPLAEGVSTAEGEAVFTRTARADAEFAARLEAPGLPDAADAEWDEVDELFRGGPGREGAPS
jgi:hypothetical protein